MKKSEAIETVTDAISFQLVASLDPQYMGEEWAGKAKEMREMLKQETGLEIFDTANDLAVLTIDSLGKAGLIFDPEE